MWKWAHTPWDQADFLTQALRHLKLFTHLGDRLCNRCVLLYIYTNANSIGVTQEELEAIVQQENYDIVAITEIWW